MKKKSLKKRMTISKKKYTKLIRKKKTRMGMTKNEKKELDDALFVNY